MTTPYGLRWESDLMSPNPVWTKEPDIQSIANIVRTQLNIPSYFRCGITFLAQGACNRVYVAEVESTSYVFRVALPLDPLKVASEAATIGWLRENTNIPTAKVLAFDTTADNELHFPWMLMEHASGECLAKIWRRMDIGRKGKVVDQLARYEAQLLSGPFDTIGGIYSSTSSQAPSSAIQRISRLEIRFCPNVILILILFPISLLYALLEACRSSIPPVKRSSWYSRYSIGRKTDYRYLLGLSTQSLATVDAGAPILGPYLNSYRSLQARLTSCLYMTKAQIKEGLGDEEDIGHLEAIVESSILILDHLHRIHNPDEVETATLFHHDLHPANIFIDQYDQITAILDWEFTTTRPTWATHTYPKLIVSVRRLIPPDLAMYAPDDSDDEMDISAEELVDRYGKPLMYWEDMEEHENPLLRETYAGAMEKLLPGWREEYEKTRFQRSLQGEIELLECGRGIRYPGEWLEAFDGTKLARTAKYWPK